jgi:hypothetical protein
MFYAFYYLFGLQIEGDDVKEYFEKFRKVEMPFGNEEDDWNKIDVVPRSKSFSLRNIPYKELYE